MGRPSDGRAAFRAWARAHHPDLGGDPAMFAEGLRHRRDDQRNRGQVTVIKRRRGPRGVLDRWLGRRRRRRARTLR